MDQPVPPTSWLAPAKINLALHITGQREDGYHLLESLVVFTRFGDRLSVEPAETDELIVTGPFAADVPADDGNLVIEARDRLRAFLLGRRSVTPPSVLPDISPSEGEIEPAVIASPTVNVAGRAVPPKLPISPLEGEMSGRTEGDAKDHDAARKPFPVLIRLEKNLPVASGIGGGSSDAAAALTALAALWAPGLPQKSLHDIALPLGADVPMCLTAKPLIASGIGEELAPITSFPPLALVLVNTGARVSTPAVFAALANRNNAPLPPLPRRFDFHSLRNWLDTTRNDLEPPARAIEPSIGAALTALDKAGSGFSRMSGSGATCFGLFETNNVAKRAAAEIRKRHPDWFVAATRSIASEQED